MVVRNLAQRQGLKLSEYGLFRKGRRVAGRTEEDVYAALGLPLIPAELREDRGEVADAQSGVLPRLLTISDIRTDLQLHTTASGGSASLEEMA